MKEKKNSHHPFVPFKKTLVEPEVLVPNVNCTFNINYAIEDNKSNRNKSFFETIHEQSRNINGLKHCEYKLYPELSRVGKVHWHGEISFKNYTQIGLFYAIQLPQLLKIAQVEIDTIADPEKWATYQLKGQAYMKKLCAKVRVDYEHTNEDPSEAGEGEFLE